MIQADQQPLAWLSAKSVQKLLEGVKTGDYAFICRIHAGPEKPRKRESAGWVPIYMPQQQGEPKQ